MTLPVRNDKFFWMLNLLVIVIIFIISARTLLSESHDLAYRVQLNEVTHYVTQGLSLEPDLAESIVIPPGESPNGKSLGGGKHSYLRPGKMPNKKYTITAFFDYTEQYDALAEHTGVVPGIQMHELGDNYKIYLNGRLIASDWHVENDQIMVHRWVRAKVFPINPTFFIRGENMLTFHIYGDPTTTDTGFTVVKKYVIDDLKNFNTLNLHSVVFAGTYLAVAVIFSIFFLLYRETKQNLWLALTALAQSLYTLFRARVFENVILEYELEVRLEIFFLFCFCFLVTLLIYSCGKNKFDLVMKIFAGITIAFCAALLLPGRQFVIELITLYFAFLIPALIYVFVTSLCIPMFKDIKEERCAGGTEGLLLALSGTLRGNMIVAAFIPIIISVWDQIAYMILPYLETVMSQYGFLFFFANVTYALAAENAKAHNKLLALSGELRTLVSEQESELLQKSGEIEEAKTSQTKFYEMVSKEIYTPLGEIIGSIELRMLESELSEDAANWLRRLLEAQRGIRNKLDSFWGHEFESTKTINLKYAFESGFTGYNKPFVTSNHRGTRHLFVINPKSFVTLKDLKNFLLSIEKCFSAGHRAEYNIYISRYPRDAYSAVHRYLSAIPREETARVYAVGGDGILFDCLNGLAKFPNAELAPIPYGNSNDFVRSFGAENMKFFRDIKLMSQSPSRLVDMILCGEQYALCSCSIGIEAKAVQVFSRAIEKINTSKARNFVPLLYNLGAVKALLDGSQNNINYQLTIDGRDLSGTYLLINIGNIALNGGSNCPNPLADPQDGIIDTIICKSSSVLNSLRMLSPYTSGQFHRYPNYFEHYRMKEMRCESNALMSVVLDGETFYTHELELKILPKAIHIVSPNGIGFADFSGLAKGVSQ